MAKLTGYAGDVLHVDLSDGSWFTLPTSTYAGRFVGGRGIGLWVHWEEVPEGIDPLDPDNRLVFATGPLCGVRGVAGSRWQVSAKSPQTGLFSYCNMGGSWGWRLKAAGFDALIVKGRSDGSVLLVVDDGSVEIRDASRLKGLGAIETREALKEELGRGFSVAAVGPAGENQVVFATLLADADSSGSSGMGAVMGSKGLKAIAVRGSSQVDVADRGRLEELAERIRRLKPPKAPWPTSLPQDRIKKQVCPGCIDGCMRAVYQPRQGRPGKFICQSAFFYEVRAQRYYGDVTEVPYAANKLCDTYGLDTRAVETMIMWLSRCHKAGILSEEEAGLPLSKLGSIEFIEALVRKVSNREGFGELLAQGTLRAAQELGRGSERWITDYMIPTGENPVYGARLYIVTGLLYALEPRMPIQQLHEVSLPVMMWAARQTGAQDNYMTSEVIRSIAMRFWGSEIAADFSTYEGKAMAAAMIQDRQYAKECLILCDFAWPILHSPATPDHVGDPTLESQLFSAVTGRELDEQGLYELGRRVFHLQRAVMLREGRGGSQHDIIDEFNFTIPLKGDYGNPECLVPGRDGQPHCRKGMVVDREAFAEMRRQYYIIRGWDPTSGFPTQACLHALDLQDVADGLHRGGLLV